jgi:hypothetical protein
MCKLVCGGLSRLSQPQIAQRRGSYTRHGTTIALYTGNSQKAVISIAGVISDCDKEDKAV